MDSVITRMVVSCCTEHTLLCLVSVSYLVQLEKEEGKMSINVILTFTSLFLELSLQKLTIVIQCARLGLLLHSCKIGRSVSSYGSLTEII